MDMVKNIDQTEKRAEAQDTQGEALPTALIIDDSEINRYILKEYIEEMGFRTYIAKDGLEGLELYKAKRPSLIFLDIVMPRLSGLDLLKVIKSMDANARVIMVSSHVSSETIRMAKEKKADWFLMKPFTKEKLEEIVRRFGPTST